MASPVPEPDTIWMLGLGMLVVMLRTLRRRN
ncbi:MAG: PEP-CTERM sorting domain-containing protein [Nitrosomonas sp.]|nr:PEP-CTERM sorting domain-containing protein [Nitrosomonas sp.]